MALARQPLVPLVGDDVAGKAHQRYHAAQEDVDLPVVRKAFQHPGADEPVVCVVEDDVGPQRVHQVVEALGGEPLEEGVGVPAAAHAVHHLRAVQILLHHLVHGVDVVLPVAVDGDGDVAAAGTPLLIGEARSVAWLPFIGELASECETERFFYCIMRFSASGSMSLKLER